MQLKLLQIVLKLIQYDLALQELIQQDEMKYTWKDLLSDYRVIVIGVEKQASI